MFDRKVPVFDRKVPVFDWKVPVLLSARDGRGQAAEPSIILVYYCHLLQDYCQTTTYYYYYTMLMFVDLTVLVRNSPGLSGMV